MATRHHCLGYANVEVVNLCYQSTHPLGISLEDHLHLGIRSAIATWIGVINFFRPDKDNIQRRFGQLDLCKGFSVINWVEKVSMSKTR